MRQTSRFTLGCLLAIAFVLGHLLARSTSGQAQVVPAPASGRFQLTATVAGVFLVDTATGKCWLTQGDKKWEDLGSPVDPKKD